MRIRKKIEPYIPNFILEIRKRTLEPESVGKFAFSKELDVRKDIQDKYGKCGELLDIFATNSELVVHKWHHYIPLYERYFSSYRGRKIRFLEIGVSKGGSLKMWRKYFGDEAIIFGIDINPDCQQYNGLWGEVRIGSQADKNFLESVVKEMGGIDLVLDDGSHQMRHISASLKYLFPHLNNGGIYMIEDLHAAYWKSFGGGYNSRKNFFRLATDIVDDIHHWYHRRKIKHPEISNNCSGIHIHDSIAVLEKGEVFMPVHSKNG